MRKSGLAILLLAMIFLGGISPVLSPGAVCADDSTGTQLRPDMIDVSCQYPSASGAADKTFMFDVKLMYQLTDLDPYTSDYDTGKLQSRVFNLELSGPPGWQVFVAESSWSTQNRIGAMQLRALGVPTSAVVVASAPWWENLEPGEYPIQLRVVSDDGALEDSVELRAVVTAWYGIEATTTDYRLNTKTTAGSPAAVDLKVTNTGTATLDKISITSSEPSGIANEQWVVRFEPDSVKGLAPGEEGQVRVSITPPEHAISGDYYVTLTLAGEPALSDYNPSLDVRVSIATRPTWLVVGAAIVVLTFGALAYAFFALRQR